MRISHRLTRLVKSVLAFGTISLLAVTRLPGRTREVKNFEIIDLQGFDDELAARRFARDPQVRDGFETATRAVFSGTLLGNLSDLKTGIAQLEKLTQNGLFQRQPSLAKSISARVNLAVAYAAAGQLTQAKKSLEEAAKMLPQNLENDNAIESTLRAAIGTNRAEIMARIERKH